MTPARWLAITTALSAALALTSCTQTSPGSPTPDNTASTSTGLSSSRPREINLDDKDPCKLIPQSDWPKFDIERPGQRSEEPNFKSPHCYYSGAGDVTLVVTEGIEAWQDRTHNAEIDDADPIEGYPTLTISNNVDTRACYAAVDVANGQYLLTTATPNPSDPNKPDKCNLAYQLAESAMKTLVAS